jgi:hypothetical protein
MHCLLFNNIEVMKIYIDTIKGTNLAAYSHILADFRHMAFLNQFSW